MGFAGFPRDRSWRPFGRVGAIPLSHQRFTLRRFSPRRQPYPVARVCSLLTVLSEDPPPKWCALTVANSLCRSRGCPLLRVLSHHEDRDESASGISSLVRSASRAALTGNRETTLTALAACGSRRPSPKDAGLPLAEGRKRSLSAASTEVDRSPGPPLAGRDFSRVSRDLPWVSCPPCARGPMLRDRERR
jgi:hypothetical protein